MHACDYYPEYVPDALSRADDVLLRVRLHAGDPEDGPYCGTCRTYGHHNECPILHASWTLCMGPAFERVVPDLIEIVHFAEHFSLTDL